MPDRDRCGAIRGRCLFPAPLRLIEGSPELPAEADAVIIGGGIIGSFASYFLAREGLKVALVEKGVVGGVGFGYCGFVVADRDSDSPPGNVGEYGWGLGQHDLLDRPEARPGQPDLTQVIPQVLGMSTLAGEVRAVVYTDGLRH